MLTGFGLRMGSNFSAEKIHTVYLWNRSPEDAADALSKYYRWFAEWEKNNDMGNAKR